jgi:hypothetical protein
MYELMIAKINDKSTRDAMLTMLKEMNSLRNELEELKSKRPPTFEHFTRQDQAYRWWKSTQVLETK